MARRLVDTNKDTHLSAPHPSLLNGDAFMRAVKRDHLFSKMNDILARGGRRAVDWRLP